MQLVETKITEIYGLRVFFCAKYIHLPLHHSSRYFLKQDLFSESSNTTAHKQPSTQISMVLWCSKLLTSTAHLTIVDMRNLTKSGSV
jgi:hypothetical protein